MGRRVVALVAAIFAALFGTPSLSVTTAPQAVVIAYTYDGSLVSVPATDAVSERGPPPTAIHYATASSPVDLASHGTSAHPFTGGSWTGTTYDSDVSLAQVASGSATTKWPDRAAAGELRPASGTSVAANGASKFGNLTHSSAGIAPFSTQRAITAGQRGAIQAHHLIERRFARQIGGSTDDWATVVVTRSEHQVFTNAWRQAIPYGAGTRTASRAQIEGAARQIYSDYPEILRALGLG